jgi:hypothetical protein
MLIRDMLKRMAAAVAPQPEFLFRLATNTLPGAAFSRVRPRDAGWPSAASWAQPNEAVGGNLIRALAPFGAGKTDPKGAPCVDASANIKNPFYPADQPRGAQVSGWLDAWDARDQRLCGEGDVER